MGLVFKQLLNSAKKTRAIRKSYWEINWLENSVSHIKFDFYHRLAVLKPGKQLACVFRLSSLQFYSYS